MTKEPANSYIVVLRANKSDVAENSRLRGLLKVALRRFGFRCLRVEPWAEKKSVRRVRDDVSRRPEKVGSKGTGATPKRVARSAIGGTSDHVEVVKDSEANGF